MHLTAPSVVRLSPLSGLKCSRPLPIYFWQLYEILFMLSSKSRKCTLLRFQSGSFYTMPNLRRLEMQLTAAHLNLSLATLLRENAALSHLVRSIFPATLNFG